MCPLSQGLGSNLDGSNQEGVERKMMQSPGISFRITEHIVEEGGSVCEVKRCERHTKESYRGHISDFSIDNH